MKKIYASTLIFIVVISLCSFTAYGATDIYIQGVPIIAQGKNELPNGCEPTALTVLLNYYGVNVTKFEVAEALPQGPAPYWKNGKLYGADPQKEFVGNPAKTNSFGIYYKPILKAIESYLPGRSVDLSGGEFEDLLTYIDNGQPVMVWATIGDANGNLYPIKYTTVWHFEDGTKFQWKGNEHALVIVGYSSDKKTIIANDSWNGKQIRYDYETFKKRWIGMGKQAVTIAKDPVYFAFSDVNSTMWHYDAISKCKESLYMGGYSDGSFKPNQNMTVAEFISVMMKTVDVPLELTDSTYWAAPAIETAKKIGIIESDQFDDYDVPITRNDCLTIYYKILSHIDILKTIEDLSIEETLYLASQFEDISKQRSTDIELYINNYISGYTVNGKTDFKLLQNITRAEVAILLLRVNDPSFRVNNTLNN